MRQVRYDCANRFPRTMAALTQTTLQTTPTFRPLTGVYEPSAIQQLEDGRFLVVEDEKSHPFSLVTIDPEAGPLRTPLAPATPEAAEILGGLDDLEGLAGDRSGYLYAVTSHSRDGDGKEKKSRHKVVRFRITGGHIAEPRVNRNLKSSLTTAHPVLAAAAQILNVKASGGLNIEALEVTPDQRHLLLGFRSPLLDGHAIVARIENPHGMFDASEPPRIAEALTTLDLGGHGIRGMAYLPALGGYLIISGPVAREQAQFQVWFWDGCDHGGAHRVTVPGLAGFEHAEGICPAVLHGRPCVVLVSDDGSRKDLRCARYLVLEPELLMLESRATAPVRHDPTLRGTPAT